MSENPTMLAAARASASQNQAAASASPLDVAAASQSGALSIGSPDASAVEVSRTQDKNEEVLLNQLSYAVMSDMMSKPLDDISSERSMQYAIKGFRRAFFARYNHVINDVESDAAKVMRTLAEAELSLAGHLAQHSTANKGA